VCSVDEISARDWADEKSRCIRWTSVSEGRLSLCLLRVLAEKRDGCEIG
jgi:hypothetical protein